MLQTQAPSASTIDTSILDAMLEEGEAEKQAKAEEPQSLDNFLDGLIQESRQEKADQERLKEIRKKLKNERMPGSTIHALREELRQTELRAEWTDVSDVIWIKRCVCEQCGQEKPEFAGYFRKAHSRLGKAYRYTALESGTISDFPREMKTEMTSTPMCSDCIPQILMEDGWLTDEANLESIQADADESQEEEVVEQEQESPEEHNWHAPGSPSLPFSGAANAIEQMDFEPEDPTVSF